MRIPIYLAALVYLAVSAVHMASADDTPLPLTSEQTQQVRELVRRTQTEQARLQTELAGSQQKLADCYMSYELDDDQVTQHQQAIVALQEKLLANYHSMHKDLRALVGAQRFKVLSKRIENVLRTSPRTDK